MNHEQLKRQIGEDLIRDLDYKEAGDNAVLTSDRRVMTISLNHLDLYNLVLIKESNELGEQVEEVNNVSNSGIRKRVENFFNISLNSALKNDDKEREKEIMEKAKNGETIRII